MAHNLRKLRLLVWKNFILQVRRPIGSLFEILVPVVMLALLVLARQLIKNKEECLSLYTSGIASGNIYISEYKRKLGLNSMNFSLAYFPINEDTTQILQVLSKEVNVMLATTDYKGHNFTTKQQVISDAEEFTDRYLGAVTFDNVVSGQPLPNKIKYSIRLHHTTAELFDDNENGRATWYTRWVYPFFQQIGPRDSSFYYSPFMTLQYYVDTGILQFHAKNQSITAAQNIQQLPYPDYTKDTFIQLLQGLMPIIFTLAYMYTAMMIVKELVSEKQFRLKESMKMMGLPNWIHWMAWFIKFLTFFLITLVLQVILLKAGKIFEFADTGIIVVFLLLYMTAVIFFLFFLSTIFSNAIRGMLFAAVIWFGSLGPYLSFSQAEKYEELSHGNKFASCLLPNTCLGIIVQIISRRESSQVGADWNNINKATSVDDNFTLAEAFAVLILDCFIYAILTWYIENVHPGDFGIPRPFYFPFQSSYWCSGNTIHHKDESHNTMIHSSADVEEEPDGLSVGVQINELQKVFRGSASTKVAVDNLSLNIYKGQITALLGHNGAGKTTTISILTGLFPPSSGSAYIDDKSVLSQMDGIRESLGLCPQHNVLFDRLTVEEHLDFFSALKGVPKNKAKSDIQQMIKDIQLVNKAKHQSSTLSGGMKRKLCCAIALIGDSKTVFLDEPTSGMDPYARRATWDLLQKYRKNKTIILTTHFMDEADYLGDRIAIMADGQLRCCGSSLFLKKRYGVGYHMTIVKGAHFSENATQSLITNTIPSAKIVGNVAAEMSYILDENTTKSFKKLFEALESKSDEYGITSFGISVTTLEEVFLKVGEGGTVETEKFNTEEIDDAVTLHHIDRSESVVKQDDLLTGCALIFNQFKAMFIKRFLNSKREKKAVFTQIILPLLLVLCGLLLSLSQDSHKDDPERLLSLAMLKTKSDKITGFFTDFTNLKTQMKIKEIARNVYASVDVDMVDITDKVNLIRDQNMNNHMGLPFTKNKYSANFSAGFKECCNYKYLILNKKCREELTNNDQLCSEDDPNFAYGKCMKCANQPPRSCGATPAISSLNTLTDSKLYFQEYILEDSSTNVKKYFNEKVAGLSVENDQYTVWYSNEAWHTLPSAFSAVSNILLQYYTNSTEYTIHSYNHPLPKNLKEKSEGITENSSNLTLIIFVTMAASFVSASFVTFLVNEKVSKAKHIQFVSGVNSLCYWGATYCWDFLNYIIPAIGILILFAAFDLDEYKGELGEVFLVLMLFGLSVLPFIYIISFLFTSALVGYAMIAILLMVMSLALVIAVFICRLSNEDDAAKYIHYISLLLPTYAFPQALADIASNVGYRKICTASPSATLLCEFKGTKYRDNSLEWDLPGVGIHCFYMFCEAIVYFIITLLIEEKFFIGYCVRVRRETAFINREGEDIDVKDEREKIFNLQEQDLNDSAVVVKDLTKVYRSSGMMAVDHLNVAIPKAECFGLLGVNGAGKTTTFGMLTGELGITDGTAYLLGYNIQTHLRDVQQRIGYCPQFDALVERLTGREMLRMFARLRGIPSHLIEDIVNTTIEQLNLGKWADKLCGNYSGGNKRKLSTAIALVGDPKVVFLDEPTSGMDPASRRFLWNTLSKVLNQGRSIVLTSHSMEECEALCTRLVIMVNGQFKCIGSIQHLKSRFGQGYTVMMKVSGKENVLSELQENGNGIENLMYGRENETNGVKAASSSENLLANTMSVKQFMSEHFQGARLIEDRQGLLQYQITDPTIRCSTLFGTLEENISQLGIVDYSVSQTSLEQVFINFAKHQHSEDRIVKKSCFSCQCF